MGGQPHRKTDIADARPGRRVGFPIATVAMAPDVNPDRSRDRLAGWIEQIMQTDPETRLIHFGETILGCFHHKPDTAAYHTSIAEPILDPTTARISDLARRHAVAVSFGMTERGLDGIYNAQVLVSVAGELVAVHRKFNVRDPALRPGERRATFTEIDGVRVALLICADLRSLYVLRSIRGNRTDLLLASLADYAADERLNEALGTLPDAWSAVSNRYSVEDGRH